MKRGQYSLEFLLTYSWAFLVIGIALAAIYSFGWINVDQVLPEQCEFYGQVFCQDFQAYTDGSNNEIQIVLVNQFGADLYVRDARIFSPDATDVCGCDTITAFQNGCTGDAVGQGDWGGDSYDIDRMGVPWKNGDTLQINFTQCDKDGQGESVISWYADGRFEGTVNITFFNANTYDPADNNDPENAVTHSQLGTLSVLVRDES